MRDQTEGRAGGDCGMPGEEEGEEECRGKHIDQISGARTEVAVNAEKPWCEEETINEREGGGENHCVHKNALSSVVFVIHPHWTLCGGTICICFFPGIYESRYVWHQSSPASHKSCTQYCFGGGSGLRGFLLFEEDGVGMSMLWNCEKSLQLREFYTIAHLFCGTRSRSSAVLVCCRLL